MEFIQLQARYEGLQEIIREKDEMIIILKQTNEKLNSFAHYFKSMEVKQLLESTTEKEIVIEKEEPKKRNVSPQKEKKPLETTCLNCGELFTAERSKKILFRKM